MDVNRPSAPQDPHQSPRNDAVTSHQTLARERICAPYGHTEPNSTSKRFWRLQLLFQALRRGQSQITDTSPAFTLRTSGPPDYRKSPDRLTKISGNASPPNHLRILTKSASPPFSLPPAFLVDTQALPHPSSPRKKLQPAKAYRYAGGLFQLLGPKKNTS